MRQRPRQSSRGAMALAAAAGVATLVGVGVYFTQARLATTQKKLLQSLNGIDGFYAAEVSMLYANELDQRGIVPPPPAGATLLPTLLPSQPEYRQRPGLLRSVLRGPNTPRWSRNNSTDDYEIPDGIPPKVICGKNTLGTQNFRACLFVAPVIDPTGLHPLILACLTKWVQVGYVIPFTQSELQTPRMVTRTFTIGGLGGSVTDSASTPGPELVLVQVSSIVNLGLAIQLTNPNGWYCVSTSSIVSAYSSSQFHCASHVIAAENRSYYNLWPTVTYTGTCP